MITQVGFGSCQTAVTSAAWDFSVLLHMVCVRACESKQMCYDLISHRFKFSLLTTWCNSFSYILIGNQVSSISTHHWKRFKGQEADAVVLSEEAFAWMLWVTCMTSMASDYPARLVHVASSVHSFQLWTTPVCITKDIMRSCLTTVVAHRYKEHYTATTFSAHAPEGFDLVKKTKISWLKIAKKGMDRLIDSTPYISIWMGWSQRVFQSLQSALNEKMLQTERFIAVIVEQLD